MGKPKKPSNKDFEGFRKATRKKRSILAGHRARDGLVLWQDLDVKEQQLFEDSYLAHEAVAKRKQHIQDANKVQSVIWTDTLFGLWRCYDMRRRLEAKKVSKPKEKEGCELALKELSEILGDRLNSVSRRLILSLMWGDWKGIKELAETGLKVCPEGVEKRIEPPLKPIDLCDNLTDSKLLNSVVLQCFFDLSGGSDSELLWTDGITEPINSQDSPSVVFRKLRPRLPDDLLPKQLPTKKRLENELIRLGALSSTKASRRFTDSLDELGLSMLPKSDGGWHQKRRMDEEEVSSEGSELWDYVKG